MASTITISGGSVNNKTILAPTSVNLFGQSNITRHVPIDGDTIIDYSANRDSWGDKNAPRQMRWDAIMTTGSEWTMTLVELKSLEGENCLLDASNCTPYTTTQNIKIETVNLEFLGSDGVDDVWRVDVTYSHR